MVHKPQVARHLTATFHFWEIFWFSSNFLLKQHLGVFFVYATSNISAEEIIYIYQNMVRYNISIRTPSDLGSGDLSLLPKKNGIR